MDQKKLAKGCAAAVIVCLLLAVAFRLICGDALLWKTETSALLSPAGTVGEITAGMEVLQEIEPRGDRITGIALLAANYGRKNTGQLRLALYDGEDLAAETGVSLADAADNALLRVPVDWETKGSGPFSLRITAPQSTEGNAITLYWGDSYETGRAKVDAKLGEAQRAKVDGETLAGGLCLQLTTGTKLWFGEYYWIFAAAVLLLLCVCCCLLLRQNRQGKSPGLLRLISAVSKYRFLIKQMVARDFKTKYKRSVLGVLWSFLNPLLTMTVQYLVFSALFRSDIPNFVLYLLIGIICYSFFSEATGMTLTSIVGNASLITKVYVPKYIYPLTRVISSTVNFLLALIPMFAVMLISGTPFRPAVLLLPIPVVCLFAVSLGIGMLLAASMVFFRDTQFLWNVVSMLWMYATPIFYPESILPVRLLPLFKCNPLYHIIRFIRIILMDGVSPEPKAYGLLLIASFVPLALGVLVFKRTQDRFVLNI